MPAVDPISKCIACQFSIDPLDFNFEIGNPLQPPTLPGLSNLVLAVLEGIVETVLFFLKPLTYILGGKIPKLIGWISDAMSGPENFILAAINLAIVDPYTSKLKISTHATTLPVPGIPDVPIPAINPGKPGFDDNPQWLFQVPSFFKFLFSILLLPIKLLIKIFVTLVTRMKFPPLNKKTFKKIWSEIVPDLGLPSIDSMSLMTKFGGCLMDQVEGIIPPPAPLDGASPPSTPPDITVTFDPGGENRPLLHNTDVVFTRTAFNKVIRIARNGTDYSFDSVSLQTGFGVPNDFVCSYGGFSLSISNTYVDVPIQYTAATQAPSLSGATLMIKRPDPNDPFYFFLVGGVKTSYDLLTEAYALYGKIQTLSEKALKDMGLPVNTTVTDYLNGVYSDYSDPWDPYFNIFGIRKEEAATNAYEDIIGCAANIGTISSPVWKIYAWKGTTRPGKKYRDLYATDPQRLGVSTFLTGFYPVIWRNATHPVASPGTSQPDCLVEIDGLNPNGFPWCNVFLDKNKTCNPEGQVLWQWNESMNCHYPGRTWQEDQFADDIEGASAGCQVFQSQNSYQNEFRPIFHAFANKIRRHGRYSYMLFLKDNVPELWDAINPHAQTNPNVRRWSGGLVVDPT